VRLVQAVDDVALVRAVPDQADDYFGTLLPAAVTAGLSLASRSSTLGGS
jgi:hypothetical protein